MPIYEFRCSSCGHQFEEIVFRREEVSSLLCPKCGQEVAQLLSAFSTAGSAKTGGGSSGCGSSSFS